MVEREAVRLGVQFGVGGKYCSFVAVEKEAKDKDDKMAEGSSDDWEFVDKEIDDYGWSAPIAKGESGGTLAMSNMFSPAPQLVLCAARSARSAPYQNMDLLAEDQSDEDMGFGLFDGAESALATQRAPLPGAGRRSARMRKSLAPCSAPTSPSAHASPLQTLIELQTFEGYWNLTIQLCKATGVDKANLKVDGSTQENAMATALAVKYLESKLASEKDSWELVVEKAKNWMKMNGYAGDSDLWKMAAGLIH